MKFIARAALAVLVVLMVGTAFVAWRTLEFGARPAATLEPFVPGADVQFVDANGLTFGYIEKGEGPLVLLMHGYPETMRSWEPIMTALAGEGYRAVAPAMRGYAPTEQPADGNYSTKNLGNDVLALISALGEDSAVIVGHDWGAGAVYEAAAAAPEKIRAVVALSIPHPSAIGPEALLAANHFLYYQLPVSPRLLWSYDFAHVDWIYGHWAPGFALPEHLRDDIRATLKHPGGVEAALGYYWTFWNGQTSGTAVPAGDIRVPALIIAGGGDIEVIGDVFSRAEDAFTDAYALVLIEDVGHFAQMEAPQIVADSIIDFLAAQGLAPAGEAAESEPLAEATQEAAGAETAGEADAVPQSP